MHDIIMTGLKQLTSDNVSDSPDLRKAVSESLGKALQPFDVFKFLGMPLTKMIGELTIGDILELVEHKNAIDKANGV